MPGKKILMLTGDFSEEYEIYLRGTSRNPCPPPSAGRPTISRCHPNFKDALATSMAT